MSDSFESQDDSLDACLGLAFGAEQDTDSAIASQSVLQSLGRLMKTVPRVTLRESSGEVAIEPLVKPEAAKRFRTDARSRYRIDGEIAVGGMGRILKGRDMDLGRDLAVKVLLDKHREKPEVVQRFVEEAQIGGQLQHPGIAPVYELGRFEDHSPFFTMKLVKGKTLSELLDERSNLDADRAKFIGIFEQICQAMAYAHSRGVIHRDLKPANIMVGAFGEVQVMDWGLAKVLRSGGIADETKAANRHSNLSVIETIRSGGSETFDDAADVGSHTRAGSVMGTPAYMPPEQALGETEMLDERADVFGLGAILCEILTGRPPYVHERSAEILRMATRGKLEDCLWELDECGAERELTALAKDCLELEPCDRPRNAEVLAKKVSTYLESVELRLRKSEVQLAAEAAKAVEERKRRKVTWALAASIMLIFGLAGGGWMWATQQQTQRRLAANGKVTEALNEARLHETLAETTDLSLQIKELEKAVASAKQAVVLTEQPEVEQEQRESANELLTVLVAAVDQAKADRQQIEKEGRLLEQLELIRVTHADAGERIKVEGEAVQNNPVQATDQFEEAFREAGFDFDELTVDEAVERIRSSTIREGLLSAIDHWLRTIPKASDDGKMEVLVETGRWSEAAELGRVQVKSKPDAVGRWSTLAGMLLLTDDRDGYQAMCRKMIKHYDGKLSRPNAVQILHICLMLPDAVERESLPTQPFLDSLDDEVTRVVGLYNPWITRALLAYRMGDAKAALEYVENAAKLIPQVPQEGRRASRTSWKVMNLCIEAMALNELGQHQKAVESLTQARELVEEFRLNGSGPVVPFGPSGYRYLILLAEAEAKLGDKSEFNWIEHFHETLTAQEPTERQQRIEQPDKLFEIANAADDNTWRIKLRTALFANDAEQLLQLAQNEESQELSAELASWVGSALREANEHDLAIEILKREQQAHPDDFWINYELSMCLQHKIEPEAALGYARAALAIRPESTTAQWALVSALDDAGQAEEAVGQFKRMLTRSDMSADEYGGLSANLRDRGRYDQAELTIRKALTMEPDNAQAHDELSRVLIGQDRFDEALAAAQKSLALDPDHDGGYFRLAYVLNELERYEEAAAAYREFNRRNEDSVGGRYNLALVLRSLDQLDEALKVLSEARKIDPDDSNVPRRMRYVLNEKGERGPLSKSEQQLDIELRNSLPPIDWETRIEEERAQLAINPRDTSTRVSLAFALKQNSQLEEAIQQWEIVLKIDAKHTTAHQGLADCYKRLGDLDAAIAEFQKAVDLAPENYWYRHDLGSALHHKAVGSPGGRGMRPRAIPDPENIDEELLEAAVAQYRKALELEPDDEGIKWSLADALELLGQEEEAYKIYPRRSSKAVLISLALRREGKIDEANALLEQVIEENPHDTRAIHSLGLAYVMQKRYERALTIYQKLLKVDELPSWYYFSITRTMCFLHRYEEADQLLTEALEADPSLAEENSFLSALAFVRLQQGEPEEAQTHYRKVLETPDRSFLLTAKLGIAWAFMEQGKLDEASNAIEDIEDIAPRNVVIADGANARCELCRYDQTGEPDHLEKAMQHAQAGLEHSEELRFDFGARAQCMLSFGICKYRQGDFTQALETLKQSYEEVEYDPHTWVFLAMTHWKLGNQEEAHQWKKRVDSYVSEHNPLPILKRYYDEAAGLIQ
jgi:tetratricopeptide (TPR) repeat protein